MGPVNTEVSIPLHWKSETHLRRIFLEGEETGNKASAAAVCSRIRNQRDGSGKKIFAKKEWLSVDQIAPYFSRLSVLYRSCWLALEQVYKPWHNPRRKTMSQRQKRSPQGLKCKDSWNCYHTIYSNYTDAAYSYVQFTDCTVQSNEASCSKVPVSPPLGSKEYRGQLICQSTAIGFSNRLVFLS